ncbi:MAG: efflux RND transporter periplasmic adaptor subunit [Planctomycetia bacterium]
MRWLLLFIVMAVGGLLGWQTWAANHPKSVRYMTGKSKTADIVEVVAVTGEAQPLEIQLVQSEMLGVVEEILVEVNDEVTSGQVLARLATDMQRLQVQQAEAGVDVAKSAVLEAEAGMEQALAGMDAATAGLNAVKLQLNEIEASIARNLVPATRADPLREGVKKGEAGLLQATAGLKRAKAARSQAVNQIRVAEDTVKLAKLSLEKTELKTRRAGIVLRKDILIGDTVGKPKMAALPGGSAALFEIASSLQKMKAIVKVSEADYSRVKIGQTATFKVDAYPDLEFEAQVTKIHPAPTNDRTAVSYAAEMQFDNRKDPATSQWMVKPGATVSADIVLQRKEKVLSVPNVALLYTPSKTYGDELPPVSADQARLWRVGPDGLPTSAVVRVGITNGEITEILEGELKDGDEIITGEPVTKRAALNLPFAG